MRALGALDAHRGANNDAPALDRLLAESVRRLGRKAEADEILKRLPAPDGSLDFRGRIDRAPASRGWRPPAFRSAVEHLAEAARRPRHPRLYHFELAHAVGHVVDENLSRSVARSLRARWPDSPFAAYRAGFALARIDPDAAIESYSRALRLEAPDEKVPAGTSVHVASLVALGDLYLNQGRFRAFHRVPDRQAIRRNPTTRLPTRSSRMRSASRET